MKFQVYPEHCNFYQKDGKLMMHGAELLKLADRQAAIHCKEMLNGTGLVPLTVGVDQVKFYDGPLLGDILEVNLYEHKVGIKSIQIKVEICNEYGSIIFEGLFSFVSFNSEYKPKPHGLPR